ncbi:allantoinase AllB [Ferruginibacter sp. HRS2-29]|uniref:allantoinase AllB n=1 Tax=Ferruginibacter sp. HRS2-29 TaxID=2487334 RepID=UPI0020CE00CA|nr:allantoinase AllB [Ferruginibacter sp. HRS2-29]
MINKRTIYSDRCWIDGRLQPATITITDGKISEVVFEKIPGAEDKQGAVLMPGVIDAHVHVNEPGRTDWEGFDTATQAAAAGGITTIIDMPLNADPVTVSADKLKQKLEASAGKLNVNVGFYGGLVPGNVDELEGLMNEGVLGIKCFLTHSGIDEFPNVTRSDMEQAMPLIAKYGIPLLAHCELYDTPVETRLETIPGNYREYLASRPKKWENDAVGLMISLCEEYDCKTHIVHVSSAEALDSIAAAKKAGLPLTAETCPHYIFFNAGSIPDNDTLYKCAPPIREAANNQLLKAALVNGTLDFLATDHSPAPPSVKELDTGNLLKAWGGIAGLQFLLTSGYSAMKDTATLEQFIPMLTEKPAIFLGINDRKGYLKKGYDADMVVWHPEEESLIREEDILHRHKASPYVGKTLTGVIKETIVNGFSVYKNNTIIHKNAGRWLLKK